jgi:hypothetical protein
MQRKPETPGKNKAMVTSGGDLQRPGEWRARPQLDAPRIVLGRMTEAGVKSLTRVRDRR